MDEELNLDEEFDLENEDWSVFEIDESQLDQEWLAQPKLYMDAALKYAAARRKWEEAKAELKLVEAETDKAVRKKPERFGLSKITDKAIESVIPLQQDYQDALDAVIEAKHAVDVYQAAVYALDHRKRALEKLVDLFLANYFSEPRAKKGTKEDAEQMRDRALHDRMRKKKKRNV